MKKVVVIGGGLAGASAAYHLLDHDPVILERESTIGGLCRSFTQDGFTFDCTGHLIHLRNDYVKELVARLLPNAFNSHERFAAIYSKETTTPYPFQANTYGLPPEVVRECLVGFVETLQTPEAATPTNFHEWVLRTFGSGIANHFMLPYNEKFWKQDLRTITADWVSWSIPKPKLEDVINGALGITNKGMGYNPRFIYPRNGGIDCLPQAFAKPVKQIYLNEAVELINARKKYVRMASGREERYDSLITTMPLPETYRILTDTPESMRYSASMLRAIGVFNINIGIDRPNLSNQHWIYFPEGEFVFSRIGFPMNFSDAVAPPGTSSMYIEITYQPGRKPDPEEAYSRSIQGLEKCGIMRPGDRVLTRLDLDIPSAYVVFDRHRQTHLQSLVDYLENHDIHTAGRYGRWDYFSMEDSIRSGKEIADKVSRETVAHPA